MTRWKRKNRTRRELLASLSRLRGRRYTQTTSQNRTLRIAWRVPILASSMDLLSEAWPAISWGQCVAQWRVASEMSPQNGGGSAGLHPWVFLPFDGSSWLTAQPQSRAHMEETGGREGPGSTFLPKLQWHSVAGKDLGSSFAALLSSYEEIHHWLPWASVSPVAWGKWFSSLLCWLEVEQPSILCWLCSWEHWVSCRLW